MVKNRAVKQFTKRQAAERDGDGSMFSQNRYDYLRQTFKIITIFVIIAEIIISVCLSGYFSNAMVELLHHSSMKTFEQITFATEQMHKQFKNDIATMLLNDSVEKILSSAEPSGEDVKQIFAYMEELKLSRSAIYSIYIYNAENDTFYVSSEQNMVRKSGFYDEEIKSLIENTGNMTLPVYRTIPSTNLKNSAGTEVLTYILGMGYNNAEKTASVVVINVDAYDFIDSVIRTSGYSDYEQFLIFDIDGRIIGSKLVKAGAGEMLKIYEKIMASEESSGFFVSKATGEKYLYSYVKPSSINQILVYMVSYDVVNGVLWPLYINILLIVCVLVVLSIIICFIFSQRIAYPVNALLDKIRDFAVSGNDHRDRQYTLATLYDQIDKTGMEIRKLDDFKKKNLFMIQNIKLKNFLLNRSAFDKQIPIDKNFMALPNYCVVIFRFDRFYDFQKLTAEDQMLYRYAFMNIAQELIGEFMPCLLVDMDSDHIAVIINHDSEQSPMQILEKTAVKIRDCYMEYFRFSVSCFLSQSSDSVSDLPKLYSSAYKTSFYRMHFGYGCFLSSEEMLLGKYTETLIKPKDIQPMINLINLSKREEALEFWHNLIVSLHSYAYFSLMTSVSIICSMLYESYAPMRDNGEVSLRLYSMFDDILACETLVQVEEKISEVINVICDFGKNASSTRSGNAIEKVLQFIKDNYNDEHLCTKSLAELVRLSPKYLSKLFYDSQQKTIQAYINQYRMDKAKEMLAKSSYTIKEICAKIGWPNIKHFYTSFKKYTGYTPTEYRKSCED